MEIELPANGRSRHSDRRRDRCRTEEGRRIFHSHRGWADLTDLGERRARAIVPLEREVRGVSSPVPLSRTRLSVLVLGFSERSARGQLRHQRPRDQQSRPAIRGRPSNHRWLNVVYRWRASGHGRLRRVRVRVDHHHQGNRRQASQGTSRGFGDPNHVGPDGKPLTLLSTETGSGRQHLLLTRSYSGCGACSLDVEPGRAARPGGGRVVFTSTVDLSKGIDLAGGRAGQNRRGCRKPHRSRAQRRNRPRA